MTAAEFLDMIHSLITQCFQMPSPWENTVFRVMRKARLRAKSKRKLINDENSWQVVLTPVSFRKGS